MKRIVVGLLVVLASSQVALSASQGFKFGGGQMHPQQAFGHPTAAQILVHRKAFRRGDDRMNPDHSYWRRTEGHRLSRGLPYILGVGDESPYEPDQRPTAVRPVVLVIINDNAMPDLPSYRGGQLIFEAGLSDGGPDNFSPPWHGQIRYQLKRGAAPVVINGWE